VDNNEKKNNKKNLLFVRVKLRGNQVAQIGDVWLESAAGTVVGKEGGMKRSRVSPEPNNSAPCRARFLRNKIFFFFFHLLLLSIINYFFFKLQIFSTSSRVWPWQSSGTLSVQCVYMQSLFLEGISVLHTTVHTGIVIPLVTSKQRSKGARAR
jgi:hypothetical protein